jgi:hypothetical protein
MSMPRFSEAGSARGAAVMRSAFLNTIDDEIVETMLREMSAATPHPGLLNFTQIRILGGAMADVRSGERLPPQPEHPPALTVGAVRSDGSTTPSRRLRTT